MYEPPVAEGHLNEEQAMKLLNESGYRPVTLRRLPPAVHVFSHIEWKMEGYLAECDPFERDHLPEGDILCPPSQIGESFPVPSAYNTFMPFLRLNNIQETRTVFPIGVSCRTDNRDGVNTS